MVDLQQSQPVRLEPSNGAALSRISLIFGWTVAKARQPLRLFSGSGGAGHSYGNGGSGGADVDLDASCLVFDADQRLVDQIWFRQLSTKDGSIVHRGDRPAGAGDTETIDVDLARLPASVRTLVFTLNSFKGGDFCRIESAWCRAVDATDGSELARFDLAGAGTHTGQVMVTLGRSGGDWSMTAVGVRTTGRTFQDMMGAITAAL